MRGLLFMLLLIGFSSTAQQHCGYDFTSYIVLHIHEDGKKENIPGLKVSLVDRNGNEIVNHNNKYSWNNNDGTLVFSKNYMIDNNRWFFPYAKDTYLLSVTNTFPADELQVKIEDASAEPVFATTTVPLYSYNMFVLCSSEQQQKAVQFGPRVNKAVDIVLERLK
ncbi:MAG TPA: hypothetical protein VFQ50_08380 [Flavobacterium sp.]|nr:hypothetical protein [Flavobacterium sp.]